MDADDGGVVAFAAEKEMRKVKRRRRPSAASIECEENAQAMHDRPRSTGGTRLKSANRNRSSKS